MTENIDNIRRYAVPGRQNRTKTKFQPRNCRQAKSFSAACQFAASLAGPHLPKGFDLSIYSQKDLDRIALSLNTRPRAVLGFRTPLAVFAEECAKLAAAA